MFALQDSQNILKIPSWQQISTSNPQLWGKWYVIRQTLICMDTSNSIEYLRDVCEQLILSAKLMSDGVDPQIGDMEVIYPLSWYPNRAFIFMEIISYVF